MKTIKMFKIRYFFIFILFIGCMSSPKSENFTFKPCFLADNCLYRTKGNTDKSICSSYVNECLNYHRLNFCKKEENLPRDMKFQECWDKLK